jgi:hypothetical protein
VHGQVFNGGGRPDMSWPDLAFRLLGIDWGWGIGQTGAGLL